MDSLDTLGVILATVQTTRTMNILSYKTIVQQLILYLNERTVIRGDDYDDLWNKWVKSVQYESFIEELATNQNWYI